VTALIKIALALAGDIVQIIVSSKDEQEILDRMSDRVAKTADEISKLPGVQADRWAEIAKAWAEKHPPSGGGSWGGP